MNLFRKKQYVSVNAGVQKQDQESAPVIPDGLWVKCAGCGKIVYKKELGVYKICPACGGYFRLGARERIAMIADEGTFIETDQGMRSKNPLSYPGYDQKIQKLRDTTGLNDAVICGVCTVGGQRTVLCVMDANFIMGSMGSVVGEKVTRSFELGVREQLPVVVFTTSGGARMQEGIVSLMQMAKVSAAVQRHSEQCLLYITVLTDPTTGGVTASFAMLGDIILSEPNALVGFAGRRVIEQTLKQDLPESFQTAEFVLEHGFIDAIVKRPDLKETLVTLLAIHRQKAYDGFGRAIGHVHAPVYAEAEVNQ